MKSDIYRFLILSGLIMLSGCAGAFRTGELGDPSTLACNQERNKFVFAFHPIEWTGIGNITTHGPGGYLPVTYLIYLRGSGPRFENPIISNPDRMASTGLIDTIGSVTFNYETNLIIVNLTIEDHHGMVPYKYNGTYEMPKLEYSKRLFEGNSDRWPRMEN